MQFAVLLATLLCFSLLARLYLGKWISAVSAFTGVWTASLAALAPMPWVWSYISWRVVALVSLTHLTFLLTYCSTQPICPDRSPSTSLSAYSSKLIPFVYGICVVVATFGTLIQVTTMLTGRSVDALVLTTIRQDLFEGDIVMSIPARIASGFSYTSVVLGIVVASRTSKQVSQFFNIIYPFFILLVISLSSGGRGPILIGLILLTWTMSFCSASAAKLKAGRRTLGILTMIVLLYSVIVDNLRPDSSGGLSGVQTYFVGPVPALSVWLNNVTAIPIFNLDITELAPVREISNALGRLHERSADKEVVFISFPFNVFTSVPEYIRSYGLGGSLLFCSLLACTTGLVERRMRSELRPAMLGLLYTYLTWSLVSDLAFLVSGWSLAVVIVALLSFATSPVRGRRKPVSLAV